MANARTIAVLNESQSVVDDSSYDWGAVGAGWQAVHTEGIAFPATQVASAGANVLDDYEEGTFSPTIGFQTPGDENIVLSTQAGVYTKIGDIVHCAGLVITSTFTHTTASGRLEISGLPFTVRSGNPQIQGPVAMRGFTASDAWVTAEATTATSKAALNGSTSGASWGALNTSDLPSGGTVGISFQITYKV